MGFWQKLAWELGFGPNLGWELGFGTPPSRPSLMEIGIALPLERRTFNVLYNEIIKLKKDFDD